MLAAGSVAMRHHLPTVTSEKYGVYSCYYAVE